MVYAFAAAAAAIVAVGEAVQQRLAAQAPPADGMSLALLLWLVRRPRWLIGVAFSAAGNVMFALAVSTATVVRAEAVFVLRLLFALVIAGALRRARVPRRDIGGALLTLVGLVAFLLAANPQPAQQLTTGSSWILAGAALTVMTAIVWWSARRTRGARRAAILGAGAGILFGVQAALTQSSVRIMGTKGLSTLLVSWPGYALCVAAVLGMVLVQNAFEAAPLAASYPAVVTGQLLCSILLGVTVLGVVVEIGAAHVAVIVPSLAAMIAGVFMLTRSHLVAATHSSHHEDRSMEQER